MAQKPIVHHRDHEYFGADPVRTSWEFVGEGDPTVVSRTSRARVWADGNMPELTLEPGQDGIMPFNHGWTDDDTAFVIATDPLVPSSTTKLIWITKGGAYLAKFYLYITSKTPGGDWQYASIAVIHHEPDWMAFTGYRYDILNSGDGIIGSHEFTIRNDVLTYYGANGQPQYLNVENTSGTYNATEFTYTFGYATPPVTAAQYLGCELEIVRLGNVETDDLHDGSTGDPPLEGT